MTTQHAQRSWRSVLHALDNLRDVVRDSTKEISDALCTHDGDWDKETRRPDGPMFFRCCQCGADLGNVGDRERPKPDELVAADAPDRIWIDDRGMWTPSPSIGAGEGSDGFGPFPEYVRAATFYPAELNADLIEILGRPNFACGRIAATFRAAGRTIKTRAEDEQAFVLHWLLGLYLKHGAGASGTEWRDRAEEELRAATHTAMEAAAQRKTEEES